MNKQEVNTAYIWIAKFAATLVITIAVWTLAYAVFGLNL